MSGSLCPVKPTKRTLPSFFAFSSASAAPPLRMNRSGSFWKLTPCICQRSRWSVCSLRRLCSSVCLAKLSQRDLSLGLHSCPVGQDFHFGFLATIDYTSARLRESVFPILSIPSDSSGRGRGPGLPRPGTENPEVPDSKRFLRHLSVPSFLRPVCFSAAAPYPVSKGSAAIRRSMLPNSRRVRWLSASSRQ